MEISMCDPYYFFFSVLFLIILPCLHTRSLPKRSGENEKAMRMTPAIS
jgi:hypothetical protein